MARVPRSRTATVDEVSLIPGDGALLAPAWVPWNDRLQSGDIQPGMLLPTPDNDPRLEPGFIGGEVPLDQPASDWAASRLLAEDLGLNRERVLSDYGRTTTAERWLSGNPGPDNQSTRLAPGPCVTCGYFLRLSGTMGRLFGACTNQYSPYDAQVVSVDHGCGGHSDVVAEQREPELPKPFFDTISVDHPIFD
jgi:hypothetical protein